MLQLVDSSPRSVGSSNPRTERLILRAPTEIDRDQEPAVVKLSKSTCGLSPWYLLPNRPIFLNKDLG